jgi:DNA (cytosine-5)-methyltransferase 1
LHGPLGDSLTYGSVCSGIEAASVAWEPLGFRPTWFSEIDPFCSALLAHRYPGVKNLGDFTAIQEGHGPIDILVGGTPCQSFSLAGRRGGLDDARGNLAIEFCRLAGRLRPRWIVWENVPGVLSSNGGRDFGSIIGSLENIGYGCAWRVLDAQFFRVPQRRRRVFLVGHLGDWRRAAAVLFEREGLLRNTPARRKAGQGITHDIAGNLTGSGRGVERTGESRGQDPVVAVHHTTGDGYWKEGAGTLRAREQESHEHLVASTAPALSAHHGRNDLDSSTFIPTVVGTLPSGHTPNGHGMAGVNNQAVAAGHIVPVYETEFVGSFEQNSMGGRGTLGWSEEDVLRPLKPQSDHQMLAFSCKDHGSDASEMAPTLRAMDFDRSHANAGGQVAVCFESRVARNGRGAPSGLVPPLKARSGSSGRGDGAPLLAVSGTPPRYVAVRRLTPRECERLQGMPDDYTLVPYRGKPAADGPRYRAIGNSMAVPVMSWIGKRIQFVDSIPVEVVLSAA